MSRSSTASKGWLAYYGERAGGWARQTHRRERAKNPFRIGGKSLAFRGRIENVFDKGLRIAFNRGVALGAPRTFMFLARVDL